MLGDPRVRYDYDDWSIISATPTGGVIFLADDLGVASWQDIALLRERELIFASQGPTSLDLVPMLAFRLLGLEVNYVFGYTGRNDGLAAMMAGDVNIDYQTTASILRNVQPGFESGELIPLMSWGVIGADGSVQRDPTFPDLPTVEEVYEHLYDHHPSGPDYETYHSFVVAGFAAQKLMAIPADTPQQIRDAWIDAWDAVLQDPEYQAAAPAVLGAYTPLTGAEAEKLTRQSLQLAPAMRDRVNAILSRYFSIRLQ